MGLLIPTEDATVRVRRGCVAPDREGPEPKSGEVDVLLVFADPLLFPAVQPYGATIVAEGLRSRGLTTELVLPYLEADALAAVRRARDRARPKIIGFSFRNLDTAGFHFESNGEETFLAQLRALVAATSRPGLILALGGSGFAIAPEAISRLVNADIGFVGTSEVEFAEFCVRVVRKGMSVEAAASGLSSAFVRGDVAPKPKVLPLLRPDRLNRSTVEFAKMVGGTVPVRTKSGCSLRCTYCVLPQIEALSLRPWSELREELRMVVSAGLGKRIFIADGEFNLPSLDHVIKLCERMRNEFGAQLKWSCYLSEKCITRRLLGAMREAGCVGLSLTADSLTAEPRRGFAKGCGPDVACEAIELCLQSGIQTGVNLLFGGPNETIATAIEGARIALEFNGRGVHLAVTVGLRVYPGTPLARMVKMHRYSRFWRSCGEVPWLGVFCSPVVASALAQHIVPILPPSPTIAHTNSLSEGRKTFYGEVARGTNMLVDGRFDDAELFFRTMCQSDPECLESKLGLLKAQVGMSLPVLDEKLP